jgi:TRAP-type uncharacterized transport system fused permease subunit
MFVIPFVFALYPEILLIEAAVIDPSSEVGTAVAYLPGYTGQVDWGALGFLLLRLLIALYLLASALARFDRTALPAWEVTFRLGLAMALMLSNPAIHIAALGISLVWVGLHFIRFRDAERAAAGA